MSEQHECCQPYPDSETQYELFVRRELLMLDQCSAEYRLYNEGVARLPLMGLCVTQMAWCFPDLSRR